MPKLPRLTARQIIKILTKKDFVLVRQAGSHKIFKAKDGRRATVPFHNNNEILRPKTLKSIMVDAKIKTNELTNDAD